MRLLIQRVKEAKVTVENTVSGQIGKGLLVFFAVHKDDTLQAVPYLAEKLLHLRVFSDSEGKMNLSLKDLDGEVLLVSQFTLYGNCSKGRRPDFLQSAPPDFALEAYHKLIEELQKKLSKVETGRFGAHMEVQLTNDGPVTFLLEKEPLAKTGPR